MHIQYSQQLSPSSDCLCFAVAATARQPQTANLANASPKGCLKELVNATAGEALQDLITPDCFNKLTLNLTNVTGGADCPLRSFTVSFADKKKCAEGFDIIANGNLTATAKGTHSRVQGLFHFLHACVHSVCCLPMNLLDLQLQLNKIIQ